MTQTQMDGRRDARAVPSLWGFKPTRCWCGGCVWRVRMGADDTSFRVTRLTGTSGRWPAGKNVSPCVASA